MSDASPAPARVPRRFRRRMIGALLAVGLLPLGALGLASRAALTSILGISLAPVDAALARASQRLAEAHVPRDPELAQAELYLAEAELTRGSLVRTTGTAFALAVGTAAVLSALAALMLARGFSRPIATLTERMLRVEEGDWSAPEADGAGAADDELAFLLSRFSAMTRQLASQRDALEAQQKLAGWREAAQVLAHEVRNPLTAMRMSLARIERAGDRPGAAAVTAEAVALLDQELGVLIRLAQTFSELARLPAAVPQRIDLRPLLGELRALYRTLAPVPLELAAGPPLWVRADPDQLRRVLGNLVKNAVEASTADSGPVVLEGHSAAGAVTVRVLDGGSGLPAGVEGLDAIQGRTTKAGGSGIGLSLAQTLVRAHGGSLQLSRRAPRGTVATVILPEEA